MFLNSNKKRQLSAVSDAHSREQALACQISFAGGLPNPKFFPVDDLADVTTKVLAEDGRNVILSVPRDVPREAPGARMALAER